MQRMRTFVIYYKFMGPGEKKPGPIRHYKLQASNAKEAEKLLRQYACYPGLEVVRVEEVA